MIRSLHQNIIAVFIFSLISFISFAQQQVTLTGSIIDEVTGLGIDEVTISVNESIIGKTKTDGTFEVEIDYKAQSFILFEHPLYISSSKIIQLNQKENRLDIGEISLREDDENGSAEFDVVSLSDEDLESDGASQNVSSLLLSRDPFLAAAGRQLGFARFRPRGYDSGYTESFVNGLPINDLDDGRINWGYWSGLNDVTRLQYGTHAMQYHESGAGEIGGVNDLNLSASLQRKQIRATYSASNRTYRNRAMLTYSTGLLNNGFALSLSGSRRWSEEGYAEATSYDAWSYFMALDKAINSKHTLGIAVFGTPTKRGGSAATTQEMYDIAGSNYYNAYWGFQDGEKRNSRIRTTNQPVYTLKHTAKWSDAFNTNIAIGYINGEYFTTRLDWYDVSDPRPDYYRKLPSWYADETYKQIALEQLSTEEGRQINWDEFYEVNQLYETTKDNVYIDGSEGLQSVTGHQAYYHLQEQHFDTEKLMANANFNWDLNERLILTGGAYHVQEAVHSYLKVNDLLGADYYLDIDKFAERDFPDDPDIIQSDINKPNRIVTEGDIYGYNYDLNSQKSKLWLQANNSLNKIDWYAAVSLSQNTFWREGFLQNGKFPENSVGESEKPSFINYSAKLGITYKLNGRNYIVASGTTLTKAPYARYAFISPRTRNDLVPNLESEQIFGGDISYDFRSPIAKARVSAFYTKFGNQISTRSFYHDEERGFVNFILSGIDKVHQGIEAVIETKLTSTFSLTAATSIGQYRYASRPSATISQDNDASLLVTNQTIYAKNYYVGGTPQQVAMLKLSYNSPKFWYANLTMNYTQGLYLDFNPIRLTEEAVHNLDPIEDAAQWNSILEQEKIDGNYSLDFFGGKSWKVKGGHFLYLNVGVNNLLNNQNYITGGYEQLRFDFVNKDVNVFPPKLYYAYGLNYFINLSFRI